MNAIEQLLDGATERTPLVSEDGKSGVPIERVVIDGERYVAKYMEVAGDWLARATGDFGLRQLHLWETGVYQRVPACIDPVVVGAARDGRHGVLLMRDVGDHLVPEGDELISLEQHLRFLDHLAALHAAFWDWREDFGLTPDGNRFAMFGPHVVSVEATIGDSPIPPLMAKGWELLRGGDARSAARVLALLDDPGPLLVALERTPRTFIHGDPKLGNLGSHPDGTTIAIDWAYAGPGRIRVRAGLVSQHQLGAASPLEGSSDRGIPGRAGASRHRHRAVVGRAARPRAARWVRAVRLGEGARRR